VASLESIAAASAGEAPPPDPAEAPAGPVPPSDEPGAAALDAESEAQGPTEELFVPPPDFGSPPRGPDPGPAVNRANRLSGAKDPFAFSGDLGGPPPLPPEAADDPFRIPGMPPDGPSPDDPFGGAPEDFGAFPEAADPSADLGPPPLPPADESPRFPPPPGLDPPEPGASPFGGAFGAGDPFAEDPFAESEPPADDAPASPFEAPPGAAEPRTAESGAPAPSAPAGAMPIAIGRIAPLRVDGGPPSEPPEPEPRVAKGPPPVPDLKWPPRAGLALGLLLAVLWLRPGAFDWASTAALGGPATDVRTVDLKARPYPLDLEAPPWLVSGKAETRGAAFPDGLEARVRVRAGPTLVADVQVPVGVIPEPGVLADGPEALEAFWRNAPRPALGPASRTPFMAVLPPLRVDPERLRLDVQYAKPSVEAAPSAP